MATILKVLLAVLLPPLAVALERGADKHLLISILLTIIGWLPGVIHALWIVFESPETSFA